MIDQAAKLRTMADRTRETLARGEFLASPADRFAPMDGRPLNSIAFVGSPNVAVASAARKIAAAAVSENLRAVAIRLEDWFDSIHRQTPSEPTCDVIIVEAPGGDHGRTDSREHRALFSSVEQVVVVAGPDRASLLNSYIAVKTAALPQRTQLSLIVHEADSEVLAAQIHHSLDASCRRFLGRCLSWLGEIGENMEEHQRVARLLLDHPEEQLSVARAYGSNLTVGAEQGM